MLSFLKIFPGHQVEVLFAQVFRGFHRGVHPVAIKVLRNVAPTESQQSGIVKEIAVLRACRHPHVVQVIPPDVIV